jgi:hypothetical protein
VAAQGDISGAALNLTAITNKLILGQGLTDNQWAVYNASRMKAEVKQGWWDTKTGTFTKTPGIEPDIRAADQVFGAPETAATRAGLEKETAEDKDLSTDPGFNTPQGFGSKVPSYPANGRDYSGGADEPTAVPMAGTGSGSSTQPTTTTTVPTNSVPATPDPNAPPAQGFASALGNTTIIPGIPLTGNDIISAIRGGGSGGASDDVDPNQ